MAQSQQRKEMVCKNCGFFTQEHPCPNCKNDNFVDKYKGTIYVFDIKHSDIAQKIGAQKHGKYALKF